MTFKSAMIFAATTLALSAPAFAQGMEGHNPDMGEDYSKGGSMQFMASENHEETSTMKIHKDKRYSIGKSDDGKTVFRTMGDSLDRQERGPTR